MSVFLVMLLAACGAPTPPPSSTQTPSPTSTPSTPSSPNPAPTTSPTLIASKTVSYQASDELFPNPERGFRVGAQLGHRIGAAELAWIDMPAMFRRGERVFQSYVSLQNFKTGPISEEYLAQLRGRLEEVRRVGLKTSLRFWYTWAETEVDAPRDVMMNHIRQLGPLLRDFSDVILTVQAGFIGAWGEWHSSANGLANDADRRAVVEALIRILPADRKVQLRYVEALKLFAPGGITEAQAFGDPVLSRIGHHNDCFMVNDRDAGTYGFSWQSIPNMAQRITEERAYLQQLAKYLPVGGEMCGDVPETGSDPFGRRTPEGQLAEFARFGWSWIANDFGYVDRWRAWGIYDTISRNLGYRLSLTESSVPETAKGSLRMSLTLKNTGWAAPVNPRAVRIVLREATGLGRAFSLEVPAEVRKWYAGGTYTLNVDRVLPAEMPAGTYQVLLHLADPYATLSARPEYAIRLANRGLWEAGTGYNDLKQTVRVER
ncbi:MAG: DUF4832 domain-containing protein [Meiothermus sp.]|nr:DUF4832 domain-containing protein [Meiothermus sp.]